ncbi:MAG: ABC transporter permease [Planctomycetaceae bacterium]|nr:ABC transporter permease [Planctomycetaceae bacterium]
MYKFLLCARYLRTRYIALASIISVMLGVATMIVVNSVMAGFSTEMRERIHGILADMVLEAMSMDGNADPERQMRIIEEAAGEYIAAMSPTVEIYGMLSFNYAGQYITRPVTLIGIEPASKSKVGTLTDHLENYKPEKDENGKAVGRAPKAADEPPDWELLPAFLEYRRMRMRQPNLGVDDDLDQELADQAKAGEKASGHNGMRGLLDDDEPQKKLTPEEMAAPLPARVYVGAQLVSFQYEDRETGRTRTMAMIQPGDDVALSTVSAGRPPQPRHFNATVVDIFKSGMSEYDSNLVFCNLAELQRVRGMFDPATGEIDPETQEVKFETCTKSITTIQIKLKNYADADKVIERLRSKFPPNTFSIRTWEQKQGPLLAAVEVESAILNVLLFLIIAVAGFGILAIFFMIVVEKTRDIGILKSLGASSQGVMSIFLSYGLSLGMVGAGGGVAVGLLFVRYINEIEAGLTWLTGRKVFDETIYYFPSIPTKVHPMMVLWVAVGAMAIAVLASILPARRAAGLNPVRALRHE